MIKEALVTQEINMLRTKRILKQLNSKSLEILISSRDEKVKKLKRSATIGSIKRMSTRKLTTEKIDLILTESFENKIRFDAQTYENMKQAFGIEDYSPNVSF